MAEPKTFTPITVEIVKNPEDLAKALQNNFEILEQRDKILISKFDFVEKEIKSINREITAVKNQLGSVTDAQLTTNKNIYTIQHDMKGIKSDVGDLKRGLNAIIDYLKRDPNRPLLLD